MEQIQLTQEQNRKKPEPTQEDINFELLELDN